MRCRRVSFGPVTAEGGRLSHFVDGRVEGLNGSRRQRKGDVADAELDDVLARVRLLERRHPLGDV